jgi:hypothetical protein
MTIIKAWVQNISKNQAINKQSEEENSIVLIFQQLMLLSFMVGSRWSSLRGLPFSVTYFLPCGNKRKKKEKIW